MSTESRKDEPKGFRVEDRRRFAPGTGETRPERPEETQADSSAAVESSGERRAEESAEVNFSSFLIGLSTQALMHLGEIPDPQTGKAEPALPMAKQVIDIIALLFDLRMRYVEAVKKR
jgi:hypothetical protein